jgi:GNAT superfamily N-acetyltransferase
MSFALELERIDSAGLALEFAVVPWDTAIFGFGVGQITRIAVREARSAGQEFDRFSEWVDRQRLSLVSCRLPHDALVESMFLEARGFRFVEMTLHPYLADVQCASPPDDPLVAMAADAADLPVLEAIADTAFTHERIYMDPRLGPELSDRRYRSWIRTSLLEPRPAERVVKFLSDGQVAGFFVEETLDDCRYWRLTALAQTFRGGGFGRRVWTTAILKAKADGVRQIRTTIAARNSRVMGLYGRLGFRFEPPNMTLHWSR